MDSKLVYDSNKIFCSDPVHIGKTSAHFHNLLIDNSSSNTTEEVQESEDLQDNIVKCMKKFDKFVTSEHFSDVQERCSIENLRSPSDHPLINLPICKMRKLYVRKEPEPDTDLETLENLQEFEKKIQETSTNINLTMERYLKYRSNIIIDPETCKNVDHTLNKNLTIITIRSYHPFKHEFGKRNTKGAPKFDCEFRILGNTQLKDLRDAFRCRQDLDTGEEKSENPTKTTVPEDKGAGLFYINGILYLDDRYPYEEGHDYAKDLQKWGQWKGMDIRVFDMNNLCFKDIYVRLGYPNVYQHRGCCEHLFLFSDVECVPKESAHMLVNYKYPLITYVNNECKSYCSICSKYVATWVTINNKRTVSEETLWCQTCFVRYNYTEDMKKIGDFKAYKFFP